MSRQGGGVEGIEQPGLVVFDREREVGAAPVHVVRGGALALKGIGGMTVPARSSPSSRGTIIGISFVLAPIPACAGDDAPLAGQGSQQVHLAAVSFPGAPGGLSVHSDGDQRRIVITAAGQVPGGAGPLHQAAEPALTCSVVRESGDLGTYSASSRSSSG